LHDYLITTVFLKPLKGLNGDIDFYNPYTYQNLEIDELDRIIIKHPGCRPVIKNMEVYTNAEESF